MPEVDLDRAATYERGDPGRMLDRIVEFDRQAEDAWQLSQTLPERPELRGRSAVVVLGMGGSAIGGELARSLLADRLGVPLLVVREYQPPAFVGPATLVIASSYSGNTEETLSATRAALAAGAPVVALTTGGRLAALVEEAGWPVVRFAYVAQPRAALGYSLFLILGVLARLGYVPPDTLAVDEALAEIRRQTAALGPAVPLADNPAKRLATRLAGKLVVVHGGGLAAEVARRWKGQLNENAKTWAFFEQLPEQNHNAILGYAFPPDLAGRAVVVTLHAPLNHPRLRLREEITAEVLQRHGVGHEVVAAAGATPLAQLCSLLVWADFVSYYLALLNGVDPTAIPAIDYLKERMAGR